MGLFSSKSVIEKEEITSGGLAYLRFSLRAETQHGTHEPCILLVHGTGFNAGAWTGFVREFAALNGPDCDLCAMDLTGHGASRALPGEGVSASRCEWSKVGARDVLEIVAELKAAGAPRVYGVGHSYGATCLVLAELFAPGTFAGLTLFEPIVRHEVLDAHPIVAATLKRMRRFPCSESDEVLAHFCETRLGTEWDAEALAGYVARGTRPCKGHAGFELCCTPETEASVYLGSFVGAAIIERLPKVRCTVAVAAGANSRTLAMPIGAAKRTNANVLADVAAAFHVPALLQTAPDCGHNVPMEAPAWAANFAAHALAEQRAASSSVVAVNSVAEVGNASEAVS